jgi:hypothetical protein
VGFEGSTEAFVQVRCRVLTFDSETGRHSGFAPCVSFELLGRRPAS